MNATEVIFEVTEAVEGGYDARALEYSIYTQGQDGADLEEMVKGDVCCHFGETSVSKTSRLGPGPTIFDSGKQVFLACLNALEGTQISSLLPKTNLGENETHSVAGHHETPS